MKILIAGAALVVWLSIFTNAQQPTPTQVVAGIPVNYDESKVGLYTLPDLFTSLDGKKITTAKDWLNKRRPEIVKLLAENQFGNSPGKPAGMTFDVFDKGTPAFGGKAIRKQVMVQFLPDKPEFKMLLLIYLPAGLKKPAPMLFHLSFSAVSQLVDDTGIRVGDYWTREGKKIKAEAPGIFGKLDVEQFIDAGFGFATVYYGDIEPDIKDGIRYSIRSQYLKPGQTKVNDNEWGSIGAWAWGMSRALDYFETDKQIDAKRVAIQGASRLGKTVLWAGTIDTRFKMVIASVSGESGAAISRRNYGETVGHISHPTRYEYWFAPRYHTFADSVDRLPVDGHFLVAAIAPRPLLLQTGSTDYWSDPKGEFVSAVAAEPVYRLFGKIGPGTVMPAPNDPSMLMRDLGYYMHDGPHGVLPDDWKKIIIYMKKYL